MQTEPQKVNVLRGKPFICTCIWSPQEILVCVELFCPAAWWTWLTHLTQKQQAHVVVLIGKAVVGTLGRHIGKVDPFPKLRQTEWARINIAGMKKQQHKAGRWINLLICVICSIQIQSYNNTWQLIAGLIKDYK